MISCACYFATNDIEMMYDAEGNVPLEDFIRLRERCLALRYILLPDDIWSAFLKWHERHDDVASHSSVCLLAYRRGYLSQVTGPIHRFLLDETGVSGGARKQYLKDLREKWMLDPDPSERHRLSRIFRGRLIELQYAAWLEFQNHLVLGLEALRQGPDIEAQSPDGVITAYEVKFFGMEDTDFLTFVESLKSGPSGGAISVYQAINYLIFRIYEASLQLASIAHDRVVVVVIDEVAWFRFDVQIRCGWIDWSNPAFVQVDKQWQQFMQAQPNGGPSATDLRNAISQINRVRVYRKDSAFEFKLELDALIR